jgi:uncharacterized iron-regulated membrane protein
MGTDEPMKDLLDFISNHIGWIFIFLLVFGGSLTSFINGLVNNRHRRLLAESKHHRDIEVMAEKRRIAEATGEAIKLLLVDDQLARDFERRLRVAIDTTPTTTPPEPVEEEEAEEVERDERGRFLPRKAKR